MSAPDGILTPDVTVIGGGIAGISAAARISEADPALKVVVVEAEDSLAYHSTGRSAAMFIRNYGPPAIRLLNIISEDVFRDPEGFSDKPLLHLRGELALDIGDDAAFEEYINGSSGLEIISGEEAVKMVPILKPDYVKRAAFEPDASDIDVHQLMSSFTALAKRMGVEILVKHPVREIKAAQGGWQIKAGKDTEIHTKIVINAAGAWVDTIAEMAGVQKMGIIPHRRSAVMVPEPEGYSVSNWPMTAPVDESWYMKPETGRMMVSPADQDPIEAMDAYPDDMVLAEGVYRFEQAVTINVTRVEHQWAGLRSFAEDHNPVVGFAPDAEGFFWMGGQGGYGIAASPALAAIVAGLVTGQDCPADDELLGMLSPERFYKV